MPILNRFTIRYLHLLAIATYIKLLPTHTDNYTSTRYKDWAHSVECSR